MPESETGIIERLKWLWLHARTNNYFDFPIYFGPLRDVIEERQTQVQQRKVQR